MDLRAQVGLARIGGDFYVRTMKNLARLSLLLALLALASLAVRAQDGNRPQKPEQLELEEHAKALNVLTSDMQQMMAKQIKLEQRLAALQDELRLARAESASDAARYLTRDDLKRIDTELVRLAKTLQEVDQKREADKKLMLETLDQMRTAIEEMRKLIKAAAALPPPSAPKPAPAENVGAGNAPTETKVKAFEYVVQSGDTISAIVMAYNAKLKEQGVARRITTDDVVKANPGLKPERMAVGQRIIIPDPRD